MGKCCCFFLVTNELFLHIAAKKAFCTFAWLPSLFLARDGWREAGKEPVTEVSCIALPIGLLLISTLAHISPL